MYYNAAIACIHDVSRPGGGGVGKGYPILTCTVQVDSYAWLGCIVTGWVALCRVGLHCDRLGCIVPGWVALCQVGLHCDRLGCIVPGWVAL